MDSIETTTVSDEPPAGQKKRPQFLEECQPVGESREECKERFRAIVELQKQFWGLRHLV